MTSSQATAAALEAGEDFAERYRIIRRLGEGGMGSVYEVLDRTTDRLRALKVMRPQIAADEDLRRRFEQEASVVGRVRSDHVVEVTDAGIADPGDTPFLVMELLHGNDLSSLLEGAGRFEPTRTVRLLAQVALGLDKVHAEGVIHRDLKLENLFLTQRDDGTPHVKILDFGVAKVVGYMASLSTTRSLGTPLYMAPEQLTGDGTIGERADLYSLAQVAFCMLVGKPYWFEEARSATSAYTFINKVVEGIDEAACERARRHGVTLPDAFDGWFAKAAARDEADRFETASELVQALADVLEVEPPAYARATQQVSPAVAPAVQQPSARGATRPWWLLLAAGALALGALLWSSRGGDSAGKPDHSNADHPDTGHSAATREPAATASSRRDAASAATGGRDATTAEPPPATASATVQARTNAATAAGSTAAPTSRRTPLTQPQPRPQPAPTPAPPTPEPDPLDDL